MSKNRLLSAIVGGGILLLAVTIQAEAQRGGHGGGGGIRGGGGGAARPAPHPAPAARPAPVQRPAAPVQHPAMSPRPTPHPQPHPQPVQRPSTPAINPGNRPTPQPRPTQPIARPDVRPPQPVQPRPNPLPAQRPDFNLPSNIARPGQPIAPDRPNVRPPAGNRPDIARPKTLPYPPNAKGNLPDWQKKAPDLFPGPRPGGGGGGGGIAGRGGINPGHPTGGDVSRWLGYGAAAAGGAALARPRPSPEIRQNFQSNYATAIGRNNNNNNFIRAGNQITNVNLSRNQRYNGLVNHAGVVNNRLRPYSNTWFRPNWWAGHRPANLPYWHYNNFHRPWSWWWRPAVWTSAIAWMPSYTFGPPIYYDYGATDFAAGASPVYFQDDVAYINDQPVAAAPVYAEQAIDLADVQTPPPEGTQIDWMPLGTFALASNADDSDPGAVLQLAISKDGLVSGTWYERQTDTSAAVEGRVDPQTQRVAIRKIDQPDVVLEVGLYNLTQPATSCLVHFGTLQSQVKYLTRLDPPADAGDPNAPPQ